MPDLSQIVPPRVPLVDARTGMIAREWYLFFLSMFDTQAVTTTNVDDLQKGPPSLTAEEVTTLVDTDSILQEIKTLPRQEIGTLGSLQQDNIPWLQFSKFPTGYPTGAAASGAVYWDDADGIKTLNLVMEDDGGVVQQIGEELYYRIKASADITNGQVVMFTGAVGASGGMEGAPATGLTAFQSEYVMGVATQDIANNTWGYVTWFGIVRGVNTTGGAEAWVDGEILYYDPAVAGGLTKVVPDAPNPKVIVASVVHAASNGILFVRPTFGSALGSTDSNVQITGLANGDTLQYNGSTQRWENTPAASVPSGYTNPPASVTLTGSPFVYQNTNLYNESLLIGGTVGGVTNLEFSRDGTTWFSCGNFYGDFFLSPSDRLRITYTTAPTVTAIPR